MARRFKKYTRRLRRKVRRNRAKRVRSYTISRGGVRL